MLANIVGTALQWAVTGAILYSFYHMYKLITAKKDKE